MARASALSVAVPHEQANKVIELPEFEDEVLINFIYGLFNFKRLVPDVNGNGPVDNYGYAEQKWQQVDEYENIMEDPAAEQRFISK